MTDTFQKDYKFGFDLAQSLRQQKRMDLSSEEPTRKFSKETDPAKAALEQSGFDIRYKTEYDYHHDRVATLIANEPKAYSDIFRIWCGDKMQKRVKGHKDFQMLIEHDPYKLLDAVKVLNA